MEKPFRRPFPPELKLVETFRYDPLSGFVRFDAHADRLRRTAALFGIPCRQANLEAALSHVSAATPLRVRLTLGMDGHFSVTTSPIKTSGSVWRVCLAEARVASRDPWLSVKTTQRALYDETRARLPQDLDEVLFLNERGEVTEGTITNVFLEREGILLTPRQSCGLLPGVLRRSLLDSGAAQEEVLHAADLTTGELFVGNSPRGLIRATFV